MPAISTIPDAIRPFLFHGLDLGFSGGSQAIGDCPFCGKEGKFSVGLADSGDKHFAGGWDCKVCGEKGNVYTFLRKLWEDSDRVTGNDDIDAFAAERGLLYPETLTHWGVVKSALSGNWLVPGYSATGELCQLYKRVRTAHRRWELRPTPTLPHQLHGLPLFDPDKPVVYLHESWGNALAFWEVIKHKANKDASVLAVANCGAVGESFTKFAELFSGKTVVLMFDNDHPREHNGKAVGLAGYLATQRAASMLTAAQEVKYLCWGPDGYAPALADGYDVRDWLKGGAGEREEALKKLLGMVKAVPASWRDRSSAKSRPALAPLKCTDWRALVTAWRKAMQWRPGLEDVLATMLAVVLSTERIGDQLFLQVIGDAGSGKTRFCEALLTSKACYPLEHLTGFHSGYKSSDGDDYSLLSRINHKTLITPEGDVLMSSPRFIEIMSQQRRIFDGTSGASFKNRKEDLRYTGLRTPWIIAGTPVLMESNQSHLGDRFLRICVDRPTEDERRSILMRVGYTALRAVVRASNCEADGQMDADMTLAYRLTGGYVDWLTRNASKILAGVAVDDDRVLTRCCSLAEFVAYLRARPGPESKESEDTKELPSRLMHQFVRLAICMTGVLNKKEVDDDVLARLTRVAVDTARGRTLEIVRQLYKVGPAGTEVRRLVLSTSQGEDKERQLLRFLKRIGVAEWYRGRLGDDGMVRVALTGLQHWRLTGRLRRLYEDVMGADS